VRVCVREKGTHVCANRHPKGALVCRRSHAEAQPITPSSTHNQREKEKKLGLAREIDRDRVCTCVCTRLSVQRERHGDALSL
jgi:hypothetical protein